MGKELKSVEIVLENCETILIDRKYIGEIECDNIKKSISRRACNSISVVNTCETFAIQINNKLSENEDSTWIFGTLADEKRNPIERLISFNDITSICFKFVDEEDESEQIYVNWGGDSEYSNEYQKSYKNNFGDLFIVISKNKSIEDIFCVEKIEEENSRDFLWKMYQ